MKGHPVVAGPASPSALADWLEGEHRQRALGLPGLGGSPTNNLVRALLEAGQRVEVVTLAKEVDEPVTLEGQQLRIQVGRYRPRARDRCLDGFRVERRQVRRFVGAASGSVVHAWWTYEFALGAMAGRGPRPAVVTAQDAPITVLRHMPDAYRAVRTGMAVAARVHTPRLVANSPYLAGAWRRQMLFRRPITVIPNVVAPVTAGPATPINGHGPVILDVSAAGPLKNVVSLVRAMPMVLARHPDARLELVGPGLDGSSKAAVLAQRLGVARAVCLLDEGDRPAIDRAYARADIFVHASLEESFGMTVAEAMSHGLPVVGGERAGAVPWLLDHGRAGRLVDPRRPASLAAEICNLLGDPCARAALGQAARARARSVFSPATVAAQTLELYEDVQVEGT